jgi:hypothetical protein
MSIPVDVEALERVLPAYGAGYLVTVGVNGSPKVVTVEPTVLAGAVVVTAVGRGSLANVVSRPSVTLVFPPREEKGFTLLVDGTATPDGDGLRIDPVSAVLHRPAAHSDGPPAPVSAAATGCGNDCRPV